MNFVQLTDSFTTFVLWKMCFVTQKYHNAHLSKGNCDLEKESIHNFYRHFWAQFSCPFTWYVPFCEWIWNGKGSHLLMKGMECFDIKFCHTSLFEAICAFGKM